MRAVLLIVVVWVVAMAALWVLADRARTRTATDASVDLLHTVLAAEERRFGMTARDYTWWDDAIANVLVAPDPVWGDNNIGQYLSEAFGADLSLVIAGGGDLLYGARDGERMTPPEASSLGAGFADLVRAARAAPSEPQPQWAAGLALLDGEPAVVGVSRFVPERADSPPTPDPQAVLVVARRLDPEWLAEIAEGYKLKGLTLTAPGQPLPAEHAASRRLTTLDGAPVATASWTPHMPGARLDATVLATMAALSLAMLALLGVFLARARRLARSIADDDDARAVQARALAESEQRLRLVIANAPVVLVVTDAEGRIQLLEGRMVPLLADIAELAPGRLLADAAAAVPGFDAVVERAAAGASASTGIVAAGHAFEAACAPVRDAAGITVGIVCVLTDVTERKAMEDALRRTLDELTRSNGELERFAYVASHDLQEPVRTMVGYAQLVRRRFDDRLDDDGRSFLSYIEEGALRMRALVQGLLTYSRLGSEAARPEPVDAAIALSTALDNLAATIRETGASVVAGRLPTVYVEPLQIMQVFQNLIGNSLKFRHPVRRPQVTILAARVADGWQFTVRDNGIGIPSDSLTSVFGLFKRLHGPGQFPGTGVGLAICQRIIERNGGRIWVTSEPDAGSAFHFVLPAVPDSAGAEEPSAAEDDAAAIPGRIAQV
ncbi:PAS fold-containing protein [Caenispirillum bisanense]|uniref:histidine kinase n=1 Tax=Caenispirillum bisanense TaxID=414052 RepID=A0A286GA51_9PROT|nr:PAS fold-containing protein [Caenispirillum bisanense]